MARVGRAGHPRGTLCGILRPLPGRFDDLTYGPTHQQPALPEDGEVVSNPAKLRHDVGRHDDRNRPTVGGFYDLLQELVTRDRHHGGALLLQVWKGFTSFTLPSGLTITVIDQCGPAPGAKVNPILESRQGTMFFLSTTVVSFSDTSRPVSSSTT